jgi:phage tail-like protein
MPGARRDPFRNYSFLVEIDGDQSAAFKSVSGLAAEVEVVELYEASNPLPHKIPGRVHFPNVTLTRGVTTSKDLWDWWQTVLDGSVQRRTVAILLLDDSRAIMLRWLLHNAWIARIEGPTLEAGGKGLAIESIELAHEGLELV